MTLLSFKRFWNGTTPALRARLIIGLLMLAILVLLLCGKKPWQTDLAALKKIRIQDYAQVYCWWAAALNLIPLFLLALTAGFWTRPLKAPWAEPPAPRAPRFFWSLVLAAMVLCAIMAAPRLKQSLWDDEEYAVRRAIVGTWDTGSDGQLKFRTLPWRETLWYYAKPTNHIFQSILSRLSNSAWRAIARPRGLQFWEPALRLPSLLAGVAALGLLAFLLLRLGYPWAGVLAACFLAVHPWYLRFVPEARGYALVFFFLLLNWLAILRTLQTGAWRWWAVLAACEFGLVYTWPAAVPILMVNNACLVAAILWWHGWRDNGGVMLWRGAVSSAVAGMAFLQLTLPCVPQFCQYLCTSVKHPLGWYWIKNVLMQMLAGVPWSRTGRLDSPYPEFFPFAHAHPWMAWTVIAAAILLVCLGAFRLLAAGKIAALFVPLWILPGVFTFVLAKLKHEFLFEWYLAFMMLGLAALAALGLTSCLERWTKRPAARILAIAAAGLIFTGYLVVTSAPRAFLRSRPVQFIRDSVEITRPSLDPFAPENRRILTVSTVGAPEVYDPHVRKALSVESLARALREADAKQLPLYLNQGYPLALKTKFPDTYRMMNDPDLFEPVATLYGIENMLDRVVLRYRPGSIGGKDLSQYGNENPKIKKSDSVYFE